jgi:thioredoxin-related protein
MKKNIIVVSIIFAMIIGFYFATNANGSENLLDDNKQKSFEEILKDAQKNKKKVVVNVYADWCSWCKKMERETFPNDEVQKELKRNFYFYRMNGESSDIVEFDGRKWTKAQLTKAFGIRGFPATIFLNYNSQPITVLPGYVDAKTFASILRYIGDDIYLKMNFDEYMKKQK